MISFRADQRLLVLIAALLAWFGSWTAAPANAEPLGYDAPAVAFGDVCSRDGRFAAPWQAATSTALQPASESWPVASSVFSGAGSGASTTCESDSAYIYDAVCELRAQANGVHRVSEASTEALGTHGKQVPRRLSAAGTSMTGCVSFSATNTGINDAGGVGGAAYGPEVPAEAGHSERELKEAEREFRRNKNFSDWFHRDYKGDVGQSVGGRNNPDLGRGELRDAYEEWIGNGRPKASGKR